MSGTTRLRLVHVSATFPPYWGGTGNVAWYNARELARLGHDVCVCTADLGGARLRPEGVRVDRLKPLLRIGNAPLLPKLPHALTGAHLVHLHYPFIFGAELVALWCARQRVPFVLTYHNDLIASGARGAAFVAYQRLIGRPVLSRAARVLAVTRDHLAHSRAAPLVRTGDVRVDEVPNGIDPDVFEPRPDLRARFRAEHGIAPDLTLAAFVGTLDAAHHYRRLDLLIRGVAKLARAGTPLGLAVVGDGPLLARYRAQARALDVGDRVWFAGGMPPEMLPAAYSAADMVVLPSQRQESFGMIVIEALACGTPVIVSALPGVRTVVERTGGGLLVPPGDANALADALAVLASDPGRRAEMAETGRQAVLASYTWPIIVRRLETIYEAVLANASHSQLPVV